MVQASDVKPGDAVFYREMIGDSENFVPGEVVSINDQVVVVKMDRGRVATRATRLYVKDVNDNTDHSDAGKEAQV